MKILHLLHYQRFKYFIIKISVANFFHKIDFWCILKYVELDLINVLLSTLSYINPKEYLYIKQNNNMFSVILARIEFWFMNNVRYYYYFPTLYIAMQLFWLSANYLCFVWFNILTKIMTS